MSVQQEIDENGIARLNLLHPSGSSAQVYLNGATVTSFKTSKGEDVIFLSSKAIFKTGKAIRGGTFNVLS
jgi:glucose-6-phosphate 1-epimerase